MGIETSPEEDSLHKQLDLALAENKTLGTERDALKAKLDATQVALAEAISDRFATAIQLAAAEARRDVVLTMHKLEAEAARALARDFLFLWWAAMRSPDEMIPPVGTVHELTRARLRQQYEEEQDRSSPTLPKYTEEERREVRRAIERWGKLVIERSEKEKP